MAIKLQYQAVATHRGLNKHKIIKASTRRELQMKADLLKAQWDEEWNRKVNQEAAKEASRQAKQMERERKQKSEEESIQYAMELTKQAEEIQMSLDNLVRNRKKMHELNPNDIKDYSEFSIERPIPPSLNQVEPAPSEKDEKYNPKPSFMTKISKSKMKAFLDEHRSEYERDYNVWKQKKDRIDYENQIAIDKYNKELVNWNIQSAEYIDEQMKANAGIDAMFENIKVGDASAIEEYIALLLGDIEFPFDYSIDAVAEYYRDNKGIIVEIFLPLEEEIPKLKSVNYIKTRKAHKESYYSDAVIKKKYESIIYQIVLLCLDNVFYIGKKYGIIENVVINGRIETVDKATGKTIQPCLLSIAINNESFSKVNIDGVDPKVWFKSARGVSAASLAAITPIAPVVQLSKEDKRFVDGYAVADDLQEGINLAAIDWQDFENLIREIFEKEFSSNGGEVKITQASRDGGVDAIAYDPDPIRGGKIVIQAKRYTNVVGVSAVRDLYGTVINEGANKGILVTTSNFGNDAYTFCQGKPLQLLNGANLLYLMEKHGYKARIDLKEAKEMLKK